MIPDTKPPPQFSAHLRRKERTIRPCLRQLCCKSSLRCRDRLLVTMKCRQSLGVLRMHLGKFRKRASCLLRNGKIFFSACGLLPIDPQEDAPTAARIDYRTAPKRDIAKSISLCHPFISEIIIGLCEISPAAIRMLCMFHFCEEKP